MLGRLVLKIERRGTFLIDLSRCWKEGCFDHLFSIPVRPHRPVKGTSGPDQLIDVARRDGLYCAGIHRRCFEVRYAHGRRAFQKYFQKAKKSLAILRDFS